MAAHSCACHYGPDGRCIWCHAGVPDKVPHVPGVINLPPPTSYGTAKKGSTYIPFSSWGRQQVRRSALEFLGEDMAAILTDEPDLLKLLKHDKIIGAGALK